MCWRRGIVATERLSTALVRWFMLAALASVCAAAVLSPSEALAGCAPATGSNITVTCSGATVNQGPEAFTGYGDSTQNGLTLNVQSGASVIGTSQGIEVCDMAQVTQLQGKNLPFSRVAIAHPEKGQSIKLVVQVPVNASFKTDVRIQTADNDPGVAAPFANCTPNGCFALFDLNENVLRKLHAATSVGKLSFADAGGHDVTVPISFKGFGEAFDALAKK